MMNKALVALAALAFATPAFGQAMGPAEYIAAAGAGDLYERQSSQLILQTTRDPRLRSFASMMIEHHSKSTADVKAAAMRARLKAAPPMLTPAQAEMMAQLRAEPVATRDAAYVAQQKAAHGQAHAIQKAYAGGGTVAPLRDAAANIVPVVEQHIEMLKTM